MPRRIDEMTDDVREQLTQKMKESSFISYLDELTDVSNVADFVFCEMYRMSVNVFLSILILHYSDLV
jgi:hypothetical protein